MKKNGTQFCWEIRGYVLPEEWVLERALNQESGLGFVLSLFLINYITLDNPFGILESPFSHYKIGIITSPLTTLQGYCVYNSG